jgi:hypothetical protein
MEAGAALYLAAKKGDAVRVRALFVAGADLHAKPVRARAHACTQQHACGSARADAFCRVLRRPFRALCGR